MTWMLVEIKRIKIRSVLRFAFLFHWLIGLFLGLLIFALWELVDLFQMNGLIPSFIVAAGKPTTSSLLVLLLLSGLGVGIIGAVVWTLITLLYNVIAGFVKGIRFEALINQEGKEVDESDGK
jgi:preprotein translocase subunit Sss1